MIDRLTSISPLVSIIMPNYNSEDFIHIAIESVLNQTYQNLELIIVDDLSSDNSPSVISKYAANDHRVVPVFKITNQGAALSRNVALDLAKGEYIAFLDSDDIWTNDKLEMQIKFMLNNNYEFIYSYYDVISNTGDYCYNLKAPNKVTRNKLLLSCFIGCSSVVIASSLLGKTRQRDIVCRNDYMFWLDILKNGDIGYCCPGTFSSYRRGFGISSNKLRNFKFYCYVIVNATPLRALLLPVTLPIFLVINIIKKSFTSLYNKIVINI
tara:strand:+ start:2488 stop:3288 length:801 start_codon:yes stop_codon:yes gene_type:complete